MKQTTVHTHSVKEFDEAVNKLMEEGWQQVTNPAIFQRPIFERVNSEPIRQIGTGYDFIQVFHMA